MADRKKTRMALVLDRSGSMANIASAAIRGLNEQVQQARAWAKDQDILCSLVTFNGDVFEHLWDAPAQALKEAGLDDFHPDGSTAMRDAVGYTVSKLLSTAGPDDPEAAYLVCIISDGETNMDKFYTPTALRELIQYCQTSKRWTFSYMGCTDAYIQEVAKQTGIPIRNMAAWSNTTVGATARGFANNNAALHKYFGERRMGQLGTQTLYGAICDQSGRAADFNQEVKPEQWAPAPKIEQALPLDPIEILAQQPRYGTYQVGENKGDGTLFANALKVHWALTSATSVGRTPNT